MHYQNEPLSQPLTFHTLHARFVAVRQATPADTLLLAELLRRLSERALHFRYMRSGRFSTEAIWNEAVRMTRGYPHDRTTLVVTIRPSQHEEAVAVAELVRDAQDPAVGEIALVVRDDWQQQGIGSFLLWSLIDAAQRCGITSLSGSMLAENSAMLRLVRALRLPYTATTRYGERQVTISVPVDRAASAVAPTDRKLAA